MVFDRPPVYYGQHLIQSQASYQEVTEKETSMLNNFNIARYP